VVGGLEGLLSLFVSFLVSLASSVSDVSSTPPELRVSDEGEDKENEWGWLEDFKGDSGLLFL